MSTIMVCKELSKYYGAVQALNQVNIEITGGKIVGLFGPNGLRYKLKKLSSTSLR